MSNLGHGGQAGTACQGMGDYIELAGKERMMHMRCRAIFTAVASLVILHATHTTSYSAYTTSNKLLVGKDPKYNSNVFIYKDSIINFDKNVVTATYCVNIDRLTEEYTADYNCLDKTIHIFTVATKASEKTLDEKRLYIYEKVVKGSVDDKLLDAVCKYKDLH
jgi:hypothetical protein